MSYKRNFAPANLIDRSQALRVNSTEVEKHLWQRLRNRQLGVKFRRQHPLHGFILDFACEEMKLCIELVKPHNRRKIRKEMEYCPHPAGKCCAFGIMK